MVLSLFVLRPHLSISGNGHVLHDLTLNSLTSLWVLLTACLRTGLARTISGEQDEVGQEDRKVTLVCLLKPHETDSVVGSIPGSSLLCGIQGSQLHKLTVQITPFIHSNPSLWQGGHRKRQESVMGRAGVGIRKIGHEARTLKPGSSSWDKPGPLGNWVQGRSAERNFRVRDQICSNQHTASKADSSQSDLMLASRKVGWCGSSESQVWWEVLD